MSWGWEGHLVLGRKGGTGQPKATLSPALAASPDGERGEGKEQDREEWGGGKETGTEVGMEEKGAGPRTESRVEGRSWTESGVEGRSPRPAGNSTPAFAPGWASGLEDKIGNRHGQQVQPGRLWRPGQTQAPSQPTL